MLRHVRDLVSFPTRRSSDLVARHRFSFLRASRNGPASELLERVRLTHVADSPVAALSHGQRHADLKLALLARSEEHTSELQSLRHLVCRLLLEKKKLSRSSPLVAGSAKESLARPCHARARCRSR